MTRPTVRTILIGLVLLVVVGGAVHLAGLLPTGVATAKLETPAGKPEREPPRPAVTVAVVAPAHFVDTVLLNGSLVARHEVLIAPEVEGLRIVALGAEEGDRVGRDHVLARLERETLEAQLAQNAAALARASAAIAQARSQIAQAEARLDEARANFERAQPLKKSGALSEAIFDQREAAARTSEAQLTSARDGLNLAEAERLQIEAQRREITWRISRTEVRAPVDGLVSRRTARLGAMATAAGEPMFRMASGSEIELEAEVPEHDLARLKAEQLARITVAGAGEVRGRVRLVSPEIDKATRLGRVRIVLGTDPALRIGAFGSGRVEIAASRGLAVPASAVSHAPEGAHVLVVATDTVATRRVTVGLATGDLVEVVKGLSEGEMVVAKAGTFLRAGDRISPVLASRQTANSAR